jgi:hypothetical protein
VLEFLDAWRPPVTSYDRDRILEIAESARVRADRDRRKPGSSSTTAARFGFSLTPADYAKILEVIDDPELKALIVEQHRDLAGSVRKEARAVSFDAVIAVFDLSGEDEEGEGDRPGPGWRGEAKQRIAMISAPPACPMHGYRSLKGPQADGRFECSACSTDRKRAWRGGGRRRPGCQKHGLEEWRTTSKKPYCAVCVRDRKARSRSGTPPPRLRLEDTDDRRADDRDRGDTRPAA